MRINLIEVAAFNHPHGLKDWRFFRIEYGGHAEECIHEKYIWLPPNIRFKDIMAIEKIIGGEG